MNIFSDDYVLIDRSFLESYKEASLERCRILNEQNVYLHSLILEEISRVIELKNFFPWYSFIKVSRLSDYKSVLESIAVRYEFIDDCETRIDLFFEEEDCLFLDDIIYTKRKVKENIEVLIEEMDISLFFEQRLHWLKLLIEDRRRNCNVENLIDWVFV